MPAAAVIPAPIAYIKVAAVKTSVVYHCSNNEGHLMIIMYLRKGNLSVTVNKKE